MTKLSAKEFFSSSQTLLEKQSDLKNKIESLESERSQLLQQLEQATGNRVEKGVEVPIALIKRRPYQSRREKDPVAHADLVHSIQTYGFRGAIWVQRLPDGTLRLIAGESRLDAAIAAGMETIPADVVETDDITAVKLSRIENARRCNLNELDDTKELLHLLTLQLELPEEEVIKLLYQMKNAEDGATSPIPEGQRRLIYNTFSEVAPDISWQSFVSVRLRLLNLPPDVLAEYNAGKLSYTKALAIAQIQDDEQRDELLALAVNGEWTIQEIKNQIRLIKTNQPQTKQHPVIQQVQKIRTQIHGIRQEKVQKLSPEDRKVLLEEIKQAQKILQAKKSEILKLGN